MTALRKLATCVALGQCSMAVACVSGVFDARIETPKLLYAEIVDWKDRPEMWFGGPPRTAREVLSVFFSTETDLAAFARVQQFNIFNRVSICVSGAYDERKELQRDASIFDSLGRIGASRSASGGAGPNAYHINIYVRSVDGGGTDFRYDLLQDPREDVCVQIRGGNERGRSASSMFIIPKSALSKVLENET